VGCEPAADAPDLPGARSSGAQPLSLVIVALDTLRADHVGLYGYARATSPRLDLFARDAFVFENVHSASPWTAPSLVSLMTSLHPEAHGVKDYPHPARLAEEATTLAEVLQRRGYATAAFSEGGYARGDFGLDQGFDSYANNPGDNAAPDDAVLFPSRLEQNLTRTIDWIEQHKEEPFFLFFQSYEIHEPYRAPAPFIRRFRPSYDAKREHQRVRQSIQRWNRERRVEPADSLAVHRDSLHCRLEGMPAIQDRAAFTRANLALGLDLRSATRDANFSDWLLDLYDAEIAYTDQQLSRLWRVLEGDDLRGRTVVAVVSDHGEGLGDHGQLAHGYVLFDEALRIVWLMRVPGSGYAPRRVSELVSSLDIAPTLLDAMGVPQLGQLGTDARLAGQGRSLHSLLLQPGGGTAPPTGGSRVYSTTMNSLDSVRSERPRDC
jgi:arylsulfatase A-like enzyme